MSNTRGSLVIQITCLLVLQAPLEAAAQPLLVTFDEPEWAMGLCRAAMECPFGHVTGSPAPPAVVPCGGSACMEASFAGTTGYQHFVPRSTGAWSPAETTLYVQMDLQLAADFFLSSAGFGVDGELFRTRYSGGSETITLTAVLTRPEAESRIYVQIREESASVSEELVRCEVMLPDMPGTAWHELGVELTVGVPEGRCAFFWEGARLGEQAAPLLESQPSPQIGGVEYVLGQRVGGNVSGAFLRMDDLCITATAAGRTGVCEGVIAMDDGGAPDLDAGSDASIGVDAGPGRDAGGRTPAAGLTFNGGGGCTCRAAPGSPVPSPSLVVLAALALLRHRRSRTSRARGCGEAASPTA